MYPYRSGIKVLPLIVIWSMSEIYFFKVPTFRAEIDVTNSLATMRSRMPINVVSLDAYLAKLTAAFITLMKGSRFEFSS